MANNSKNDEFPTIRLDEEDRRDYQTKRQAAPSKTTPPPSSSPSAHEQLWRATFMDPMVGRGTDEKSDVICGKSGNYFAVIFYIYMILHLFACAVMPIL